MYERRVSRRASLLKNIVKSSPREPYNFQGFTFALLLFVIYRVSLIARVLSVMNVIERITLNLYVLCYFAIFAVMIEKLIKEYRRMLTRATVRATHESGETALSKLPQTWPHFFTLIFFNFSTQTKKIAKWKGHFICSVQ